jgi:hypothetical protein
MDTNARSIYVKRLVGWLAVTFASAIGSVWAFWGIIENFHEGWYSPSLASNLGLMVVQYLSPLSIFVLLALVSLKWPIAGSAIFAVIGIWLSFFFLHGASAGRVLILFPMLSLALLFGFGRPKPLRRAALVVVISPLLIMIVSGAYPAYRVATRDETVLLGPYDIRENGLNLEWAPAGPGWPHDSVRWSEANRICRHLSPDGRTVLATEPKVWRLPTVDEAVRSMNLHGHNAGGVWNSATGKAEYRLGPDKEAPLWNPRSRIVYWWTATQAGDGSVLMIVYDGKVWPRPLSYVEGNLGFRAVRSL